MSDELQALRDRCQVLEMRVDDLQNSYDSLRAACGQTLDLPMSIGLTRHEAGILGVLLMRKIALKGTLMAALYSDARADDDVPEEKIIDVFVCKLRKKLKAFDIDIDTAWGQGYSLAAGAREKLIALMDAEGIPTDKLRSVA